MAERVQLRRTKGYRKPENTINVARPTYWGNPFKVGAPHPRHGWPMSIDETIELYRRWLEDPGDSGFARKVEAQIQLKGSDLACWCPADRPCHADVLLEIANG